MAAFGQGYSAGDPAQDFQGGWHKVKYSYPAVISYDFGDKVYYVDFPDMKNCFADGLTLREALDNAEDVLNLMLLDAETQGIAVPEASDMDSMNLHAGEIAALITADTELYSRIAV